METASESKPSFLNDITQLQQRQSNRDSNDKVDDNGAVEVVEAGLLSLPVEMIQQISRLLEVKDILSCSLTCQYLRSALNHNSVWKKFLPEQDVTVLETQEQLVKPSFREENSLTSLCESRQHFVRKTCLLNNWKQAKFVKFNSKTMYNYASGVFNVPKGKGQIIYKNEYLFLGRFISDIESDAIEVWDIKTKPVLHSSLKMNDLYYECFYIVDTYLVVVRCFKVSVYHITIPEKEFPLFYSFLITEDSVTYHESVDHPGGHDCRCVGWRHSFTSHYLISNKCAEPSCIIHVWDIVSASKVGCFTSPVVDAFSVSLHSSSGYDWILHHNMHSSSDFYYCRFNISQKQFHDSVFKYTGCASFSIFYGSNVILFKTAEKSNSEGWYDTVCLLYEFPTSLELKRRQFNNARKNYIINSTKVFDNKFIVLCLDAFHIVDVFSLDTVHYFKYEDARFITHNLNVLGSMFILTSNSRNGLDVWDLKSNQKTAIDLGCVYTSHLYLNDLCTKLACVDNYNGITVFNFW